MSINKPGFDCCDIRAILLAANAVVSVVLLGMIYSFRRKYKHIPDGFIGIIVLLAHFVVYCIAASLKEFGAIDSIAECIKISDACRFFSWGVWAEAIRLQTLVELILMTMTVARRQKWINDGLK